MAEILEIDFTEALAHLQRLLGQRVCVVVNVRDCCSGIVIEDKLLRVETLDPDNAAVRIVIGERQGIVLDPEDVDALLVRHARAEELEFHLAGDLAIRLGCAGQST